MQSRLSIRAFGDWHKQQIEHQETEGYQYAKGCNRVFAVGGSTDRAGGRFYHPYQYHGSAVCDILVGILVPNYTFLVFFSCTSGKYG